MSLLVIAAVPVVTLLIVALAVVGGLRFVFGSPSALRARERAWRDVGVAVPLEKRLAILDEALRGTTQRPTTEEYYFKLAKTAREPEVSF